MDSKKQLTLVTTTIIWILVVLMFGCSPTPRNIESSVGLPTSNPTVTLVSSMTSYIPSPVRTKTPTTMPTSTITLIPSPVLRNTPIAVQRLELEEAKQKMDFLSADSNCQLPCFNGLTPGVSSVWDIQDFFSKLGFSDNMLTDSNGYEVTRDGQGFWRLDPSNGSIGGQVPYLLTSNFSYEPFLAVAWDRGLVTNINLGPLPYRTWVSVPRLYENLGKPDTIKIAESTGEGNEIAFILTLYFSNYKTYIGYIVRGASLNEVCLNAATPTDTFIAMGLPLLPDLGYELRNWHELNGMDFIDLVNKVATGDFCIPYAVEK